MQGAKVVSSGNEYGEIRSKLVANDAFGQVLSSCLPSLYRVAYRMLGNTADAEDAVQDALLSAYTHLEQFRGQSKMSTWLAAIVHNSARMQLRRRLRHPHVPLDEPNGEMEEHPACRRLADCRPSPEDECRDSELDSRIGYLQNQLTPSLRKAYQLRHVDGLSIRETAQILGVPHGTVKAQTARARKKIRELMRRGLKSRPRNLARSGFSSPWRDRTGMSPQAGSRARN
jgi:RNA polymerase sigma factor (sigma-70 family)